MSWATVKLGDICTIEKGQTGIQKAIPGIYPLVVTSEERKSHNEFQFDAGAVIIPLVSGTGHGHASIKRIHYQTGKFALGSILCAVIPKDKNVLNPEYLFRFLELNKENELVARMKGMANVTLPMKEIAKIEIPLPPIKEQIAFVNNYKILVEKNSLLLGEFNEQLKLIKQIRQSFLREAMQGKLLKSKLVEGQETGQQLLEQIKSEKAKLIAEKKLKKEKELPANKQQEIPFAIPKHWTWCRLGEIAEIKRGKGPKYSDKGVFKMLNQKCVRWFTVDTKYAKAIDLDWYNCVDDEFKVQTNDVLVNSTGDGTIGRSAITTVSCENFIFDSHILRVRSILETEQKLLCYIINSEYGQNLIESIKGATSTKQTELGVNNLSNFYIPLPPLDDQRQIVSRLQELYAFCDNIEDSIKESQNYNDMLLQQILREALQPKKEVVLDIDSLFEDKNYNLHVAMIQTLIESQLGINHGEVANQKTIFHVNTFTNEKIPYQFVNHHFGTFSQQLRDDFNRNPYLTKATKNNKEVFIVKSSKQKEVLDSIYKPENKNFVTAVKEILDIYELPFINKETDKIELLNTVSKLIIDLKSADLDVIYQGMKDWKIIQQGFSCKADKFSKLETERMIKLIQNKGLAVRMLSK